MASPEGMATAGHCGALLLEWMLLAVVGADHAAAHRCTKQKQQGGSEQLGHGVVLHRPPSCSAAAGSMGTSTDGQDEKNIQTGLSALDQMALQLQQLEDGAIHVCMEQHGLRECCFVSSHHLVAAKEAQLQAAITRKAMRAFPGLAPVH